MLDWRTILEDKRLPIIALVVIALLILYTAINIATDFFLKPIAIYHPTTSFTQTKLVLPNIAGWHLFGFYQDRFLPKTSLELDLAGIMFNNNTELSQALIGIPGEIIKVYKEGQEVPGGAKIYKILPNRVVLQHDNKLETLPLIIQQLQLEGG